MQEYSFSPCVTVALLCRWRSWVCWVWIASVWPKMHRDCSISTGTCLALGQWSRPPGRLTTLHCSIWRTQLASPSMVLPQSTSTGQWVSVCVCVRFDRLSDGNLVSENSFSDTVDRLLYLHVQISEYPLPLTRYPSPLPPHLTPHTLPLTPTPHTLPPTPYPPQSSPPSFCANQRTQDLDALLTVINTADKFVYIAVMDYFPAVIYGWPQ